MTTNNKKTEKLLRAVRKIEGLMESGDLTGAAKLVTDIERRAAEAGIQSASLAWISAIILDNQGEHEKALEAIEVAVTLDPLAIAYSNSRLVILGNIASALTDPSRPADQANTPRLWAALVQAGEANAETHLCLARYHLAVNAPEEALAVLAALTKLDPTCSGAWLMRTQLAARLAGSEGLAVARAEESAAGAAAVAFVTPTPAVGQG